MGTVGPPAVAGGGLSVATGATGVTGVPKSESASSLLTHINQTHSPRLSALQKDMRDKSESAISAFIRERGGNRLITSVLIANNGLAAVKFIRSVRQWSLKTFGNERLVTMVAMATPEDMRVGAEHIRMADQIVEVLGGSNNNNYANVRLIVEVAQRAKIDAVWPGWGHASEFPDLPRSLLEAGIVFLGPPAEPMAALGDKVGSTILAQAAGVPTLAWSGSGVSVSYEDCEGVIPEDVYLKACISNAEEAAQVCTQIGYPVMLKASWGGGGKGIRKVFNNQNVEQVFQQVQGEVPGSPVFAMKLAPKSRHLEVQLLADTHGNVCALFSRDCSIQRRHQKIVEEGPVTVADDKALRRMEVAACNLARSVGYVGAATVEYLYLIDTGEFCFLELNPRLQVEHPVTEWISNVNIPACQLLIGMGVPLWAIPDIRRLFNESPSGPPEPIDFKVARPVSPSGHVVAVRLTSEDATDGFKPTSGSIDELSFRSTPDVWGYFSVKGGGGIHEFADSQFGHLFAKGETRAEAINNMSVALADVKIRGEIRTTVDYVIDMLKCDDFVNNQVSTSWLDERIEKQVKPEAPVWWLAVVGGAVSRAHAVFQQRMAEFVALLEKGQIPSKDTLLEAARDVIVIDGIKYKVAVAKIGPEQYCVTMNGSSVQVVARSLRDGGLLFQLDGNAYVAHSEAEALGTRMLIGHKICLLEKEMDPSKIVAVTPGKLVRWLVEDGSHVGADQPYAEVEVMKMIMPLLTSAAGVIAQMVGEGQQLVPGQLLAKIKLDDESSIKLAEEFTGTFPEMGPPVITGDSIDQKYAEALQSLTLVLAGYEHPVEENVSKLLSAIDDPELAVRQWNQAMSSVQARLPPNLLASLKAIVDAYAGQMMKDMANGPAMTFSLRSSPRSLPFPSDALLKVFMDFIESTPDAMKGQIQATIESLVSVAYIHQGGREAHASRIVRRLLEKFLATEEIFRGGVQVADVIEDLRLNQRSPQEVLDLVVSHQALGFKCKVIFCILSAAIMPYPHKYRSYLRRLVALESTGSQEVALRAKHLLEHSMLAELRSAVTRALSGLEMFQVSESDAEGQRKKRHTKQLSMPQSELSALIENDQQDSARLARKVTNQEGLFQGLEEEPDQTQEERVRALVTAQAAVDDPLASLLDHPDSEIQWRAVETYVQRLYAPYLVDGSLKVQSAGTSILATWCYANPTRAAASAACGVEPEKHFGIMVILHSLVQFPAATTAAAVAAREHRAKFGQAMARGNTLHVAIIGNNEATLRLPSNASILFKEMKGASHKRSLSDEAENGSESEGDGLHFNGTNFFTMLKMSAAATVRAEASLLQTAGITTLSFVRPAGKVLPQRFGFQWSDADNSFELLDSRRGTWQMEPPVANLLDIQKLQGLPSLYCPSRTRQWHLFVVTEKTGARTAALRRVFLRGVVRKLDTFAFQVTDASDAAQRCKAVVLAVEPHVRAALAELERAQFDDTSRARSADWAHIFLSVIATALPAVGGSIGGAEMASALRSATSEIMRSLGPIFRRTTVSSWEARLLATDGTAWRVCVSLPSGFESDLEHIDVYREGLSQSGEPVYAPQPAAGARPGPLAGQLLSKVYGPLETLQRKRLSARRLRTTYCYDFPQVFETAVREVWLKSGQPPPSRGKLLDAEELVLNEPALQAGESLWNVDLVSVSRPPGQNDVGMIAWVWTLCVPECPEGRQVVVVANDASHGAGSFGPREDAVFKAATDLGVERKLPVVYLSVNSGARFGLAEEVRSCFKVAWNNDADPGKGIQYLYLQDSDYERLKASVKAEPRRTDSGERRWVLTDIIGQEDGIGVECLSGSGAIASSFSRAYAETFTLTFVTGRAVGIGAYLARLGHRVVQRTDQPIILTGFAALNKLLGREVYTSHMQLGGPKVMGFNGVSHMVVEDDVSGAEAIVRWLGYVPCVLGGSLPITPEADPVDRPVAYSPEKDAKLDPRAAVAGAEDATAEGGSDWVSGMFDSGSWTEVQAGWAKSVVTGHARLGGVPCGVVAVEVDSVTMNIPADPGDSTSSERILTQAGQVWYPDSALKTAQAIEEFDREGLPLFILANWRGFSGGMRDLFEGVLQNGARIVEALRVYKNPCFVYLPPGCELRGGAWAVLDSKINPERIEMYADPTARGNVLEPEGMVEIKFRQSHLVKAMRRLDPELRRLGTDPQNEVAVSQRQQQLLPPYRAVAVSFADMHDKSERMHAKGIVRKVVPWRQSRRFFYWRLRRRVAEDVLARRIREANDGISGREGRRLIAAWYDEGNTSPRGAGYECETWQQQVDQDRSFVRWSEQHASKIDAKVDALVAESAAGVIDKFMRSSGALDALVRAIKDASATDAQAYDALRETRNKLQELLSIEDPGESG